MRPILLIVMITCIAITCSSLLSAAGVDEWQELNTLSVGFYKEQKITKASGAGRQAVAAARELPESEKDRLASSLGNLAIEEKDKGTESPALIPVLTKLEKYYRITGSGKKEKEVADRIAALRAPAN